MWKLPFVFIIISNSFSIVVMQDLILNCTNYSIYVTVNNLSRLAIPFECEKYPVGMEVFLGIIFFIIVVGAIGGNFLVILAIILVKKLQTASNWLILSLAFSDFFVSVLVMPIAAFNQLSRFRWPFSEKLCDFYNCCDVMLCTSSILNLCAISIDRYLVITRPMQYVVRRTPALIGGMIGVAWLMSGLISIPPVLGWKEKFTPGICQLTDNLLYQIYATFCAFYIPLIVMLVLYYQIFKLARNMAQEDAKRKLGTGQMTDEEQTSIPIQLGRTNSGDEDRKLLRLEDAQRLSKGNQGNGFDPEAQTGPKNNAKKKKQVNNESKAITTLGVIMGCFTLCWLPFFIIQILKPILIVSKVDHEKYLMPWCYELFLWLGYFNSFLNPVIYAKFNREFRNPFKQILFFHCFNINARIRVDTFAEQYGLPMQKTMATSLYETSHLNTHNTANSRRRSSVPFTPVSRKNKSSSQSRPTSDQSTNKA
uniref:Serotonin receptor-like planarian receptor 4 n=1 Tax=Dugesia japonica TaxID=6161 RepID=O15969_DUGJA|nr:serotonin receptor-like planarian receptor 4 [Dugesia japonica]